MTFLNGLILIVRMRRKKRNDAVWKYKLYYINHLSINNTNNKISIEPSGCYFILIAILPNLINSYGDSVLCICSGHVAAGVVL